jgi:dienelactone hydrolase
VAIEDRELPIQLESCVLDAIVSLPPKPRGLTLFAHGSGSSRLSPRNRFVARTLNEAGIVTVLFDLLTAEEEGVDMYSAELRFDIELLADRLSRATDWAAAHREWQALPRGYFGASTGAAAALTAAARRKDIRAIVSRGGRPDLAGAALREVFAPTLLIAGGNDMPVIDMNQEALGELPDIEKRLDIIPKATHLFSEPGSLEEVARLAKDWFERHLS